ncbi:MAG: hypothetical protein LBD18_05420 [Treponema sp.]|jgi:hypothetical protein|nr:hypothetical protein [Treponema sp.]
MAKKPNTSYAPGELDRVREKLGDIDEQEAKRMAQILGGEVGYERGASPAPSNSSGRIKREKKAELVIPGKGGRRPGRRVEVIDHDGNGNSGKKKAVLKPPRGDTADDPAIQLKTSYFERIKMDRFAAQFEFEIKNSMQALISILSFFSEPVDYVSPRFVSRRMNEYYHKLEQLVASTRTVFPRGNIQRNERLKKISPVVYAILDTIRRWNIEQIDSNLAKIQSHPRSARVSEFADILRAIYKPLFILEQLDMETHIKGAYKLLCKIVYIENPLEFKEKSQDPVRIALAAFADIRRDVHYSLYPLLMKHISDRWFPYERIFVDRRRRFMAFLKVTENDQIKVDDSTLAQIEKGDISALQEDINKEEEAEDAANDQGENAGENPGDPENAAKKTRKTALDTERKALDHSCGALETLFPKAGWDRLPEYPDMYPYFANTYGLRRGFELIAPTDPLLQIAVLMHILDDICVGLRYTRFGSVAGSGGTPERIDAFIGDIITNWRRYIDDGFLKEYLPRLTEYCRILENSAESRTSVYAKRTLNELHWTKRLYFLPYYKFESLGPPPFQKQEIRAIYSEVRTLRKYLTIAAGGIEQGSRQGGADAKVPCDSIENPWEAYNFAVPNPVSKRLDTLLAPGKRNNAALVFFALAVTTTLDYLINAESSWAYGDRPGVMFRSINDEGIRPMFGVDNKLDADQIFKDTLKQKEGERQKPAE